MWKDGLGSEDAGVLREWRNGEGSTPGAFVKSLRVN